MRIFFCCDRKFKYAWMGALACDSRVPARVRSHAHVHFQQPNMKIYTWLQTLACDFGAWARVRNHAFSMLCNRKCKYAWIGTLACDSCGWAGVRSHAYFHATPVHGPHCKAMHNFIFYNRKCGFGPLLASPQNLAVLL